MMFTYRCCRGGESESESEWRESAYLLFIYYIIHLISFHNNRFHVTALQSNE
jgi:hypothetical protein